MNGTTENVAPSAICTNRLKTISAGRASASASRLARRPSEPAPRMNTAANSQRTRPWSPQRPPKRSPNGPAERPGEQVHQAERRGRDPGRLQAQAEVSLKYSAATLLIVNSIPKQAPYSDEQRPDPAVTPRRAGTTAGRPGPGAQPGGPEILQVALGRVPSQRRSRRCPSGSRRPQRRSSQARQLASLAQPDDADEPGEDQRHDHLRHSAAQVPPAGGRRVRRADAVRGEHH